MAEERTPDARKSTKLEGVGVYKAEGYVPITHFSKDPFVGCCGAVVLYAFPTDQNPRNGNYYPGYKPPAYTFTVEGLKKELQPGQLYLAITTQTQTEAARILREAGFRLLKKFTNSIHMSKLKLYGYYKPPQGAASGW